MRSQAEQPKMSLSSLVSLTKKGAGGCRIAGRTDYPKCSSVSTRPVEGAACVLQDEGYNSIFVTGRAQSEDEFRSSHFARH